MHREKLANPEDTPSIIPHALYNNHKQARKQIQNQREQAQHTISFLEREAKRTARELENKQKSLINYYQLKESRFKDFQHKEQLRKKREESLNRMRSTNSQLRQMSARKRTLVREQMLNYNRQSASSIKNSLVESERKLSAQKQLQNQLLRKRNNSFSRALAQGRENSKERSFFNKRHKSSAVTNDLIYVQTSIKNRQAEKITFLTSKQQELLNVVEKNRRVKNQYDQTLKQFQTLPFQKIYPTVKRGKDKTGSSRRSSFRSESLLM